MQLAIGTLTFFFDRGESKLVQKGPVIGSAWKDNKILAVRSTTSQPAASGTVLRQQKDGTRVPESCPDNIITTSTWVGLIEKTSSKATISAELKAESFISTYSTFSSMWPSQMHTFYTNTFILTLLSLPSL